MKTFDGVIHLDLPHYIGDGESSVMISRKLTPGFEINGTPVSPSTLVGVKESGARFLQIQQDGKNPIKVVEHMISALVAAQIDAAYIQVETSKAPRILGGRDGYMPVLGPGIQPVYDRVKDLNKHTVDGRNEYKVQSKKEFTFQGAKMIIEPSESFDIVIQTDHKDLADIGNDILRVDDVLSQVGDHSSARPIARLQNYVTYGLFKTLNFFPSTKVNGISPETYVMGYPNDTGNDIVGKMQERYQSGRNEHLYHTIYADFLAELHTFFPGEFEGKITLLNTNHLTRIALLRMLQDSQIVQKKQK